MSPCTARSRNRLSRPPWQPSTGSRPASGKRHGSASNGPPAPAQPEEFLHAPGNPFLATLGIRVDPAPAGTGTAFRVEVGHQSVPLYIYKNTENFAAAMEQHVSETLRQGLYGWQVTDCTVSLIRSQYSVPDGPPSTRGPLSSPQDFRKLTPWWSWRR